MKGKVQSNRRGYLRISIATCVDTPCIITPGSFRFVKVEEAAEAHGQARRRCPRSGRPRPGLFLSGAGRACARARRSRYRTARCAHGDRRGLVGEPKPKSSARQPHEGGRGQARRSRAQAGIAQLRRLGVGLYARSARHGAADGPAHGRASRPRSRAHRRTACGAGAQAHDRGAQPRARAARRRACPGQERGRARSRRFARGH